MTTVILNDDLINKIVATGHYQSAQEAVETILAQYMQTQEKHKTHFDTLCVNVDMDDDEIDSLFQRNKDTARITLSEQNMQQVIEVLTHPPEPNTALLDLMAND
jgi:hypothetical protein